MHSKINYRDRTKNCCQFLILTSFILGAFGRQACSQAEVAPWGNITGIRIEGQLMDFESKLSVVATDWSEISSTGKELQRPRFSRNGNKQVISTNIGKLLFKETVEDVDAGIARVDVGVTANVDSSIAGIFFSIDLPWSDYSAGSVQLTDAKGISLADVETGARNEFLHTQATGIKIVSPTRQIELVFEEPTLIIGKKEIIKGNNHLELFLPVHSGDIRTGQEFHKTFTVKASGEINRNPINLILNTSSVGSVFEGLGGNFRLQNPKGDPQVIDYCLKNMRVAWSRVELPWGFWQPDENSNPIDSAKAGKINPRVTQAMEMAQRLGKMGIPIILSGWFPPRWAIVGEPNFRPRPDGVWGNPLDKTKMNEIYKSITDYIIYLREKYGVEIKLFSFNESDLGINIRQTGEEHADLIKGLGAYFVSRGVKTKMLLGDNSDANTYKFIYPAMADPATRPYIGAISFHSWRGWEKETLEKWADAAKQLNVPLIVGEGSIDAAAWNYPAIFEEQTYALEEINLYVRILAICQPLTILQWQLTSDYSPLAGGGIFGNNDSLRPTQRFWNLKQLASTPKGLQALTISSDRPDVSCAAMGNNAKGVYSIQLVNNGTAREVTLSGLPKKVKMLHVLTTGKDKDMQEGQRISVTEGQAKFKLEARAYTTLISN